MDHASPPPPPDTRLTPGEALALVLDLGAAVAGTETLPLEDAAGRVLAADLAAARDMPPFDNAAMDGYGVGPDAPGLAAPFARRLVAAIAAGHPGAAPLGPGEAVRLFTGAPVPPGVAAILFEEACSAAGGEVTFLRPVREGQNIRRRGEDARAGEAVLRGGTRLGAPQIALAAAAGAGSVVVRRRARIGILSIGSELVPAGAPTPPGAIPDANRPMLRAALADPAVALHDLGIVADDDAALAARLGEAQGLDLLVSSAAASGSAADRLAPAIRALGGEARRLHLAQRPGKPLLLARIGGLPVLGLAGNPLAALVGALLYARPLAERLTGRSPARPTGRPARLLEPRPPGDRTEWLPAELAGEEDGVVLLRVPQRFGSAHLTPLATADGLAEVAPGGAGVRFHAFRDFAPGA